METSARATRTTVIAAVFLAALMLGVPSSLTGGKHMSATDDAAAVDPSRLFIVGGLDFTNAVGTLSPFKYTSAQEMMTIWPCMSTLLTYDMEGKLIGDLAQSWTTSPDGLTWYFKLEPNIYFTDPANPTAKTHQLTWDDVNYTIMQTMTHTNNLQNYFRAVGQNIITRVWGSAAANTVNITLSMPYAPFVGSLTATPIIPKYYWQPHENAQGDATAWTGALPIGSGPWYYGLSGLPSTGEVVLRRSPIWFQEADRGWQVHVDTLKYRSETDAATAWNDLKLGNIDVYMAVPPSTFLNDLPSQPTLIGWAQSTGFVYEFNLNQMTTVMRSQLGTPYTGGGAYANQILQDPTVKRAMAMAVDKQGFVDQVLGGLGNPADSLVPDVNPWYFSPQNQVVFDIAGANALLTANNYIDNDADGIRECGANSPAVLNGLATTGAELNFRYATLNTATEWQQGANLIANWMNQIGVKLNLVVKSYSQLSQDWMKADYDTWLWDWMFSPTSDPSTDVMSVLTTMEIGTWQDLYWSNSEFDRIYNLSLTAMDPTERRVLTDDLQQKAYDNLGCQLVAYRKELYAAWKGEWGGYGDWKTHFQLMPDQLYPYLYMQISPNGTSLPEANRNTAPQITSLDRAPVADKGAARIFTGSATDDKSVLSYQWFWGDGTAPSGWGPASVSHTYAKDGYYTAYFAVKEMDGMDNFITVSPVKVTVNDNSNTAPRNLAIALSPENPNTGNTITFTGSAIDDQGDPLSYTWSFGDAYSATGPVATHKYANSGSYNVKLSVTDNHVSTQIRPVTYTKFVTVTVNSPPTLTVPSQQAAQNTPTYFTVSAQDADHDALKYTWLWGDGGVSVTTVPTALHQYSLRKTYTLTVWADDQTGIKVPAHNVSGSNSVVVGFATPHPPTIVSLTPSPALAEIGQAVTFTGVVSDPDGGVLKLTFNYGGGVYDVWSSGSTIANEQISHSETNAFATAGTKNVFLSVIDATGQNYTLPTPVTVTVVVPNQAPQVSDLTPITNLAGVSMPFVGDAFDEDNPDLRYTWSFGDGSAPKVGQSVSYAYPRPGSYTVTLWVDDLTGLLNHNVSKTTTATINFRLNLAAGWNLVSLPMVRATAYKASTLGLSSGDQVIQWDPATKTYKTFVVGLPLNDFTIAASTGYWVYSAGAKQLTLSGTTPTAPQTRSIGVPVGGGWVLVGMCSMNTGWKAQNLAGMYSGSTMTQVLKWDTTTHSYMTYVVGLPLNNFSLVPGQGYWIFVNGSGTLTYNP